MALLSIVIPVYRVEATLNRCVESVLSQDLEDFEVILVDDGSTDRCPQMCDEWAQNDRHVRVIHKQNGGLSDARNAGIDIAQGDYITFIDSDDFIDRNTYAPLMQRLTAHPEIDIIEYPVYVFYQSRKQHLLRFPDEKTYQDMETYWYEGQAYRHTYACNKIYKKELFIHVRYPVGIVFEDAYTLPQLLREAQTVVTANQGLYYYCCNKEGITATADGKALDMLLQPHVEIVRTSRRRDKYFQLYYLHVLNIQMDVWELTGDTPILPLIHVDYQYFKGTQRLKATALNILGIKRLCKLNKIIHKVWRNR